MLPDWVMIAHVGIFFPSLNLIFKLIFVFELLARDDLGAVAMVAMLVVQTVLQVGDNGLDLL